MGNSEILISRDSLPKVDAYGKQVYGPTMVAPVSAAQAGALRKDACERLAIAERIDQILAEQAEEKLIAEGYAIAAAADRRRKPGDSQWTALARAAREVYGIK